MVRIWRLHCGLGITLALAVTLALVAARTAGSVAAGPVGAIAFERDTASGSAVYVMSADGKSQRVVTGPDGDGFEPSWTPKGDIGFVSLRNRTFDLYRASPAGGSPQRITRDSLAKGQPVWSQDGEQIAFAGGAAGHNRIYLVPSSGGKPRPITRSGGEALAPAWSPGGSLAYASNESGRWRIYVLDTGGQPRPVSSGAATDLDPSWSPDGTVIAFTRLDEQGNYDVWLLDPAGGKEQRLTTDPAQDFAPTWSPDGRYIAFVSSRDLGPDDLNYEVYVMSANGEGQQNISRNLAPDIAPAWAPAGVKPPWGLRTLAISLLTCNDGSTGNDILNGTSSGELICGKAGDDVLNGNGGNDDLRGGDGKDTIDGGGGADQIAGGAGADTLRGGSGGDRFWSMDSGVDVVRGGPGNPGPANDRAVLRDPGDDVREIP